MLTPAYAQVVGKDVTYKDVAIKVLQANMCPMTAGETRRSNALAKYVN